MSMDLVCHCQNPVKVYDRRTGFWYCADCGGKGADPDKLEYSWERARREIARLADREIERERRKQPRRMEE